MLKALKHLKKYDSKNIKENNNETKIDRKLWKFIHL